jgi:hypothetical protein
MPTWVEKQIDELAHQYKRHGGKGNRHLQVRRLKIACRWIVHRHRLTSLKQIGKRHIIDFYINHRTTYTYSTLKLYYYAFASLWTWLGRTNEPPRPHQTGSDIGAPPTGAQDETVS